MVNFKIAPEFVTHLPPPVNENTRIIAVCGTHDYDTHYVADQHDESGRLINRSTGNADPIVDGWFLSDFYAFMHLLQDSGAAAQSWLTAEDPHKLVDRYGNYLHGNPCRTRKVVLSRSQLDHGFASQNLTIVNASELKTRFIEYLKQEVQEAQEKDQRILLLMFGHKNDDAKGVWLCDERFDFKELQAIIGARIDITIMSTACYSGGWTVLNHVHKTAVSPTRASEESLPWPKSISAGPSCGGLYISPLIKEWQKEAEESGGSLPFKKDSFPREFGTQVLSTLSEIDRQWQSHEIRFNAEPGEWGADWTQLSTLPMSSFQQRWSTLQEVSTEETPKIQSDGDSSDEEQNISTLNRTGSVPAAWSVVFHQIRDYLSGFPGPDEAASNHVHGMLRRLLKGQMLLSKTNLCSFEVFLAFRLRLSAMATGMLYQAQIDLPYGQECSAFDLVTFQLHEDEMEENAQKAFDLAQDLIYENVLPDPATSQQGLRWNKPHRYLAAAIALDPRCNCSKLSVENAVRRLEQG